MGTWAEEYEPGFSRVLLELSKIDFFLIHPALSGKTLGEPDEAD